MEEKLKGVIRGTLILVLFMLPPWMVSCSENKTRNETVYITRTGDRYHTKECTYLANSMIEIRLQDALEKGYAPCKRCEPPHTN